MMNIKSLCGYLRAVDGTDLTSSLEKESPPTQNVLQFHLLDIYVLGLGLRVVVVETIK